MRLKYCCQIDNVIVGVMKNNIRFVMPEKRFEKRYGFKPSFKTWGSRLRDNKIITAYVDGEIMYEELEKDYETLINS